MKTALGLSFTLAIGISCRPPGILLPEQLLAVDPVRLPH